MLAFSGDSDSLLSRVVSAGVGVEEAQAVKCLEPPRRVPSPRLSELSSTTLDSWHFAQPCFERSLPPLPSRRWPAIPQVSIPDTLMLLWTDP